jgi:hypothetical protein
MIFASHYAIDFFADAISRHAILMIFDAMLILFHAAA